MVSISHFNLWPLPHQKLTRNSNHKLVEKESLLLTSTLKTPETTMEFQRHVLEAASGASPHCYDALKLAFGNTIDVIEQEQERRRIEAEREAREKAKKQAAIEEERKLATSRPTLNCTTGRLGCVSGASFQDVTLWGQCSRCYNKLVCSGCGSGWTGSRACHSCNLSFR